MDEKQDKQADDNANQGSRIIQFGLGAIAGAALDMFMPNSLEEGIMKEGTVIENLVDSTIFSFAVFLGARFLYKKDFKESLKSSGAYFAGTFAGQTLYQITKNLY